eukprot:2641465-Ditylum_brightwellii.AAC.1
MEGLYHHTTLCCLPFKPEYRLDGIGSRQGLFMINKDLATGMINKECTTIEHVLRMINPSRAVGSSRNCRLVILLEFALLLRVLLALGSVVRSPLLLGKLTQCTNRNLTLAYHIRVLD